MEGRDLVVVNSVDGQLRRWPLAEIESEAAGDLVRLARRSGGAERLLMSAATWRDLAGAKSDPDRVRRARDSRLALALCALAVGIAAFIFIGAPRLADTLARATPKSVERRLGAQAEVETARLYPACKGAGQAVLLRLGEELAGPGMVRVRAVKAPMANALALPGGAILVTDDLIARMKTSDELAGVVAHEVAHEQNRDSLRALWRAFGMSLLGKALLGDGAGAIALDLGALGYSRHDEAAADERGQALLHQRGLSSLGMAAAFERLGDGGGDKTIRRALEFGATHPDTNRRVLAARTRQKPGRSALTAEEWAAVRTVCSD